jgi:hypothetical protein
MSVKELAIILLIVLADMATTCMLMSMTNTCSLEHNPFLKSLCNEIGYGATLIWLSIEFSVISLVYNGLKKLRQRLGAIIEVEKIFLVLATIPVVNNTIHLFTSLLF